MKTTTLTQEQISHHMAAMHEKHGTTMTTNDIIAYCKEVGVPVFTFTSRAVRVERGQYAFNVSAPVVAPKPHITFANVVSIKEQPSVAAPAQDATVVQGVSGKVGRVFSDLPDNLIPEKDPTFVPFGAYKLVETAIKSNKFFCFMISGESGGGKSFLAEQACARTKRDMIMVQISKATTEQDLLGDFRLVAGETPFYYGPVVEAMKRGAVLVLDELTQCDSARIMCLQNVMGGRELFIKKTGELVKPAPGFCIICTGNSIGEGDQSMSQLYANEEILNEAFRDRITASFNHVYPSPAVESKIMINNLGEEHTEFANNLVKWAQLTRANFAQNKVERQITTRRLIHICNNFKIFGDKMTAIELALNRFTPSVAESFLATYVIIDPSVDAKRLNSTTTAASDDTTPDLI